MKFFLMTAPLAIALTCLATAGPAQGETLYALLNNDPSVGQTLITFDSGTRAVTSSVVLQTANTLSPLASIDVRPATGELYGFDGATRQQYKINPVTGALTTVGAPLTPADISAGGLIDFNPTVDRIRLLGVADENRRLHPDTGAVVGVDGSLAYAVGDVNAGDNPNIRGIGYTNSFDGASSTTLFGIDVDNDVLVTQNPPNVGTLNTVGSLGIDLNTGLFGTFTSFDISGDTGVAYLTDGGFGGASNFYTVNLTTGATTNLGTITGLSGNRTVAAIAVASPAVVVPEPTSVAAVMVGSLALVAARRRR